MNTYMQAVKAALPELRAAQEPHAPNHGSTMAHRKYEPSHGEPIALSPTASYQDEDGTWHLVSQWKENIAVVDSQLNVVLM